MNTPTPGWQPPSSPTPPQKRRSKRKIILGTVFGIFALFVVVSVIAAIVSPQKSGSPKAAISALPQATTASVAPTPAAPTLSAGEAKFVRTVKAAMQAHGDELTSSDAQVVAVGQQICSTLGNGVPQSTVISASKNAQNRVDMSGKEFVLLAEKDLCPTVTPAFTEAQQQAIDSAQGYLAMGQGFSKKGLMDQLTSKAGEGFSHKLAAFALAHIKVNWMHQAVLSAKGYVSMGQGFSYNGLVEQLHSSAGEGFTLAQAQHGASVALR